MVVVRSSARFTLSFARKIIALFVIAFGFIALFFTDNSPKRILQSSMQADIAHADVPSCGTGYSCASCSPGAEGGEVGAPGCEDGATSCETCENGCGFSCAVSEGSTGADGGGAGKLICTELFRQGLLAAEWYEADERFAMMIPLHVREGYQWWARPIVRGMKRSRRFTSVVNFIARPWAQQMAFQMGVAEHPSRIGAFLMIVAVPVCGLIGRVLEIVRTPQIQAHLR